MGLTISIFVLFLLTYILSSLSPLLVCGGGFSKAAGLAAGKTTPTHHTFTNHSHQRGWGACPLLLAKLSKLKRQLLFDLSILELNN